MDTEQKSIIITGAGSGIGSSCAQLFLENGYRVGLVGRRANALEETAGDVIELRTHQPTLEDVFIDCTGHRFLDEE